MKLDAILSFGQKKKRRTLDRVRDFATVVGAGSVCKGNFVGDDNYAVYGRIEGDCRLDGTLLIGEGGQWKGQITAANVVIAGTVEGNVTAREKLELTASARISGNLDSPVIAIAEGAVYDGKIRMDKKPQVTHYTERRGVDSPDK